MMIETLGANHLPELSPLNHSGGDRVLKGDLEGGLDTACQSIPVLHKQQEALHQGTWVNNGFSFQLTEGNFTMETC